MLCQEYKSAENEILELYKDWEMIKNLSFLFFCKFNFVLERNMIITTREKYITKCIFRNILLSERWSLLWQRKV